jgi:hypothetical protein
MISQRHPALQDDWGTMDGLNIYTEEGPYGSTQSCFYNGWKSNHYLIFVLCVAHNRMIPIAFNNVPSCVHDSTVAD